MGYVVNVVSLSKNNFIPLESSKNFAEILFRNASFFGTLLLNTAKAFMFTTLPNSTPTDLHFSETSLIVINPLAGLKS
ncbi:MAG: hypothetical protein E7078_05520 [Bacteroidales bacterium]|nr:hypothetical protein [Bacteroidales bacterium]